MWIVPLALVAAVVLVWASAWFEGHVAPLVHNPEIRTLGAVDTGFGGAATDQGSLGMDDQHATELDRPIS